MEERPERKSVRGIIEQKNPKTTGPKGEFVIDGSKYVCWSETYWEKFDAGDEVDVIYVVKENVYNGKTYYNKNISHMKFQDEGDVTFSKKEKESLEEIGVNTEKLPENKVILKSENGKIKLGGIFYRIKEIELELIQN